MFKICHSQNLYGHKKSIETWALGHLFVHVLRICAEERYHIADVRYDQLLKFRRKLHIKVGLFIVLQTIFFRKAPQLLSEFHLGTKLKQKVLLLMHLKTFEGRLTSKHHRRQQKRQQRIRTVQKQTYHIVNKNSVHGWEFCFINYFLFRSFLFFCPGFRSSIYLIFIKQVLIMSLVYKYVYILIAKYFDFQLAQVIHRE